MRTTNQNYRLATLFALFCSLAVVGCGTPSANVSSQPTERALSKRVTAVSYPLSFFVDRLVGESIDVISVTPPDGKLDAWRPSREQILSMQDSDVIFVNGSAAPYAAWLPHVTLPESRICQTANDGLKLSDMIAVKDIRIVHSHGPEGEHSHPTMVAYPWLDPAIASKQVAVVSERLSKIYPDLKRSIEASQNQLTQELAELSSQLDELNVEATTSASVLTDSPDLKFLTRAVGVEDIHLNWAKQPSAEEAKTQLEAKLSALAPRPTIMLFTRTPSPELRKVVESFDLKIVVLDTMAYAPNSHDYLSVMRDNINQLKPVFAAVR